MAAAGHHRMAIQLSQRTTAVLALLVLLAAWAVRPAAPPGYTEKQYAEWQQACAWLRQNTPPNALILTPRESFGFKWFAERAEYVCYKDCPQDAAGIVEWNRRLQFLQKWFNAHFDDEKYTVEELRDFRKQTGITHILTDRIGPVELDPVFGNDTYDVYDLTTLD